MMHVKLARPPSSRSRPPLVGRVCPPCLGCVCPPCLGHMCPSCLSRTNLHAPPLSWSRTPPLSQLSWPHVPPHLGQIGRLIFLVHSYCVNTLTLLSCDVHLT